MRFYEKAMIAFIILLIVASAVLGSRAIALFFTILLGAALAQSRSRNGGHGDFIA